MDIVGINRSGELDCRSSHVDQKFDAPVEMPDLGEEPDVGRSEGRAHRFEHLAGIRTRFDSVDDVLGPGLDVAVVDVVVLDQVSQNEVSISRRQVGVQIANAPSFSEETVTRSAQKKDTM